MRTYKEILLLGEFHPYHPFTELTNYRDFISKICNIERHLIQHYKPTSVFLETYEVEYEDKQTKKIMDYYCQKRDDIKNLAKNMNAKFIIFSQLVGKNGNYEDCLIEQLFEVANSNIRTAAIIGQHHMKKAGDILKEEFELEAIDLIEKLKLPTLKFTKLPF